MLKIVNIIIKEHTLLLKKYQKTTEFFDNELTSRTIRHYIGSNNKMIVY